MQAPQSANKSSRWPWVIGGLTAAATFGYLALSYSDIGTLAHDPSTMCAPSGSDAPISQYFKDKKGLWIFTRHWSPEIPDPVAVVFMIHGMGEHSGRVGYHNLANNFLKMGIHVFALDHQGHGLSNGSRAYVESYEDFLDDVEQFVQFILQKFPNLKGLPIFLLGHSMGGAITLGTVAFKNIPNLAGIIVSAPAINLHKDPNYPEFLSEAAKYLAQLVPKFSTLPPIDPYALSRNKLACEAYSKDPLIYHGGIQANMGYQLLRLSRDLDRQWSRIHIPMLILHGSNDKVVDVSGSHVLNDSEASKSHKILEIFPGMLHEMWEDPEADRVLQKITEWMVTLLDSHGPKSQ